MADVPAAAERARVDLEIELAALLPAMGAHGFRLARRLVALLALARTAPDPAPARHPPIIVLAMGTNDDRGAASILGIRPGAKVAVVNEPDGWLDVLAPPAGVTLYERASEPLDVIVYFSDELANVRRRVPVFAGFLVVGGVLWMATPDDAADLGRDVVEAIGSAAGLVTAGALRVADGWTAVRFERR